jgi:hypothetical protein
MYWKGQNLSNTVYFLMGFEELMITKKGYGDNDIVNIEN